MPPGSTLSSYKPTSSWPGPLNPSPSPWHPTEPSPATEHWNLTAVHHTLPPLTPNPILTYGIHYTPQPQTPSASHSLHPLTHHPLLILPYYPLSHWNIFWYRKQLHKPKNDLLKSKEEIVLIELGSYRNTDSCNKGSWQDNILPYQHFTGALRFTQVAAFSPINLFWDHILLFAARIKPGMLGASK